MLIDGNIYRALMKIKKDPQAAKFLVDEEYRDDILKLVGTRDSQFELEDEFEQQYKLIKDYINSIGAISSKEDLDVIKEAQKYLRFILQNEAKLASIEEVKRFKEAVLEVLDEADPKLRDQVIRRLADES